MKPLSILVALPSLLVACNGVPEGMFRRNRVEPIVNALLSPDQDAREKAGKDLDQIGKQGLTEAEGLYAIQSAARGFPPAKYKWQDVSADLISAATRKPHGSYVSSIASSFSAFSPRAQEAALRLLGSIDTPKAAEVFVASLRRCSESTAPAEFRGFSESPRHAGVLFPSLLDLLSRPNLRWPVLHLTLSYLQAGQLRGQELQEKVCTSVARIHRDLRPSLLAYQRPTGTSWVWADEYQDSRSLAALVLDVLGHVSPACAEPELRLALGYSDPRLIQFAVVGLLRSGKEAPTDLVLRVAESPECRNWFFRGLKEINRSALFPTALMTQRAFAESDMVNWLTFPTELGRAPDEIELMAVIPSDTPSGPGEYYVFRFRTYPPHWAAKDGWMAGIAGPFLSKDAPSTEAQGDTFSTFAAWDSKTPEEHLRGIVGTTDASRELRKKER